MNDLTSKIARAMSTFWRTRRSQASRQRSAGRADQGARSAVTGDRQMDGFIDLLTELIITTGVPAECIFRDTKLELPGYFRAEKKWDLLAIRNGELAIVIEAKSQVGSFGNNFNNRTEEAMGSALDLWTAYREGALNKSLRPWLGYLFVLEDSPRSRAPVAVKEPHFDVLPEFRNASYAQRYEIFCRKLVRERHYDAAGFLMSPASAGRKGAYSEPSEDLSFASLAASLVGQASSFASRVGH